MIIINKIDLVDSQQLHLVEGLCKKLNNDALILKTQQSRVDLKEILNTKKFNFEKAQENSQWLT